MGSSVAKKDGLRERLDAVWSQNNPVAHRYVARAFKPGQTGWGVWDRKAERYLSDDELMGVPATTLANEPF